MFIQKEEKITSKNVSKLQKDLRKKSEIFDECDLKICHCEKKSKKKGVTLVEVVIAMALAVIVSASVYLTCSFTLKSQNQNMIQNFFSNEIENVAMCYYHSNDTDDTTNYADFIKSLVFLTGLENAESDYISISEGVVVSYITLYYTADLDYLEKSKKEESAFKLVFSFVENENGNYNISCYSISTGNLICSREV